MFSRIIVPSLLLAAFASGLAIRRDDDSYPSSSSLSLPTVSPQPILLPDPSFSLSLPPLSPSSTRFPSSSLPPSSSSSSSSLPSVVTKTVYVTRCSPTPTPGPSSVQNDLGIQPTPTPGFDTQPTPTPGFDNQPTPTPDLGTQPTPITLPQASPLNLPPVRRDNNSDSVVAQLRALEQQVMNTYVAQGKGDVMLTVIGQIENLIAQAVAPGADLNSVLQQAQDVINNS